MDLRFQLRGYIRAGAGVKLLTGDGVQNIIPHSHRYSTRRIFDCQYIRRPYMTHSSRAVAFRVSPFESYSLQRLRSCIFPRGWPFKFKINIKEGPMCRSTWIIFWKSIRFIICGLCSSQKFEKLQYFPNVSSQLFSYSV